MEIKKPFGKKNHIVSHKISANLMKESIFAYYCRIYYTLYSLLPELGRLAYTINTSCGRFRPLLYRLGAKLPRVLDFKGKKNTVPKRRLLMLKSRNIRYT